VGPLLTVLLGFAVGAGVLWVILHVWLVRRRRKWLAYRRDMQWLVALYKAAEAADQLALDRTMDRWEQEG